MSNCKERLPSSPLVGQTQDSCGAAGYLARLINYHTPATTEWPANLPGAAFSFVNLITLVLKLIIDMKTRNRMLAIIFIFMVVLP